MKYGDLYNSVSFDQNKMTQILTTIEAKCRDHTAIEQAETCVCNNLASVSNIEAAVSKLKTGKSDGVTGFTTDHVKHGSRKLRSYNTSILFSMTLFHGYVPSTMRQSTIVPILKNQRKALNNSDNYRGISLNNILGKVLDFVLILTCRGFPNFRLSVWSQT